MANLEEIELTKPEKMLLVRALMEHAYTKKIEFDYATSDSLEEHVCDAERMETECLIRKLITFNF